jgi:hypothetical protein
MTIRFLPLACLLSIALFPSWSAQGTADLNPFAADAPPAVDAAPAPGASCTAEGQVLHCNETLRPEDLDLDGFAAFANPPCEASEGTLADLPSGYAMFRTAADQQFSADVGRAMEVVGLGGCAKVCGCAGCIGMDVFGYFVFVCGGCLACCDPGQAAECSCVSPYVWQAHCSCSDPPKNVLPGVETAVDVAPAASRVSTTQLGY